MASFELRRARKHSRLGLPGLVVVAVATTLVFSLVSPGDGPGDQAAAVFTDPGPEPLDDTDLAAVHPATADVGQSRAAGTLNAFPELPSVVLAVSPSPVVAAPAVTEPSTPVVASTDSPRVVAVAPAPVSPLAVPTATQPAQPSPAAPAPAPEKPNFRVPEPVTGPITDLERRLLSGINAERAKAGLAPYTLDAGLSRIARVRVQQMVDQNYFGHRDQFGYSMCSELLAYFGYSGYAWAGENLAMNNWGDSESPERAVVDLMKSATHQANLLASDFFRIGVGELTTADGHHFYAMIFLG